MTDNLRMNQMPYATEKRTSYENFAAVCPCCGKCSIFNRVSDLKECDPIAFKTVQCLSPSCSKPFNINGDSVNAAHEMLVFDCHELLRQKHYMNCIITLAQAHEVFFSLFLRVELLYKPFAKDDGRDIDRLNRLSEQLAEKVKNHTFAPMRALFLRQLVSGPRLASLSEAEAAILRLPERPTDPADSDLEKVGDPALVDLLKALKRTTIHEVRNRVVHKRAYRPSRDEAKSAFKSARKLLFPLTHRLGLHDEINWYLANK